MICESKIAVMQKKTKVALITIGSIIALGVIAAIAVPPIYSNFVSRNAADRPSVTASSGDSSSEGSSSDSGSDYAGTWNIKTGSEAGYRLNEVLNGTDVVVTGRTSDVTGTLTIDDDNKTLSAAEIEVDVTTIKTDNDRRDNYFRTNTVNTAENPKGTFKLTKPVTLKEELTGSAVVTAEVTGDLTLNGVTKEVTLNVDVAKKGSNIQVAGVIPITFADYNIEAPSLGFVSVEPTGDVEFQLLASK